MAPNHASIFDFPRSFNFLTFFEVCTLGHPDEFLLQFCNSFCFKSPQTDVLLLCCRSESPSVHLVHEGSRSNIRTDFMHILAQLISSKAVLFFISGENSGWVSISLLLIISFAFDLYYGCSVRHSFIHHSWWRDGAFRHCAD